MIKKNLFPLKSRLDGKIIFYKLAVSPIKTE